MYSILLLPDKVVEYGGCLFSVNTTQGFGLSIPEGRQYDIVPFTFLHKVLKQPFIHHRHIVGEYNAQVVGCFPKAGMEPPHGTDPADLITDGAV